MKDKQIEKLIRAEEGRQKKTISLIASENYVSKAVLEAMATVLTNKYSEGYPGHRYYGGNQVIDEGGAHGARVAEPTHLGSTRAPGKDRGARAHRITLQINQDVEIVIVDAARRDIVGIPGNVHEVFTGLHEARAHGAFIVGAVRVREYLEFAAVVQFQHFGQEVGGRVLIKIGGKVTDPQRPMICPEGATQADFWSRAETYFRPLAGVGKLLRGCSRFAQQRERNGDFRGASKRCRQLRPGAAPFFPGTLLAQHICEFPQQAASAGLPIS